MAPDSFRSFLLPGCDTMKSKKVTYMKRHMDSPLNGKIVLFLGSSVTYGSAAEGQSFVELFETFDGVNAIKEAKSGTTLADMNSPLVTDPAGEGDSYIRRLKKVDTDTHVDCVLCQLSTNDASQKLPLGETGNGTDPGSFDTSTVTGAMEYIIAYSRETWACPVVFYTGSYYDSEEYAAMVRRLLELRDKWGIGVIDLYTDREFNNIDKETYNLYMSDAIHPTKAGYAEWWMPKMESELIRILSE